MAATTTGPQPTTPADLDQRAAFQILGSDIDHTWTGNWHNTLAATADRWTQETTPADPGLEQHLAEASLLPPLHTTQPTTAA